MATYRQVHISFWQDGFVLSLTPEEKYFYLYLMTNSKTTQCGIYELPKRIVEMETGYNRETVDKLLDRFIKYRKIDYCELTQEIIIYNWIKHNSINSPKVKACILKELKTVKHQDFITLFHNYCIRYGYSINSLSIDLGEEKEKEEEKEKYKNNNDNPFKIFEAEGFGTISSVIADKLNDLIDTYGERWTCEAMKRSVFYGKRSLAYVNSILMGWKSHGVDEPWTLDKPPDKQTKLRQFPNRQGKPKIQISKETESKPLSPEEREALRQSALKRDNKEVVSG